MIINGIIYTLMMTILSSFCSEKQLKIEIDHSCSYKCINDNDVIYHLYVKINKSQYFLYQIDMGKLMIRVTENSARDDLKKRGKIIILYPKQRRSMDPPVPDKAETWPAAGVPPEMDSPWDHAKGVTFVLPTQGLFFRHPNELNEFLDREYTTPWNRKAINKLIDNGNVIVFNKWHVVVAKNTFLLGRGLVYDDIYGDGYLVLDFFPNASSPPLIMDDEH